MAKLDVSDYELRLFGVKMEERRSLYIGVTAK
jgi:hypothetical protein